MNEEQVRESFVARIWLEHGDKGETIWRGHIRHIQGEEQMYFQDLLEMSDFLGRVSGVTGLPLAAQGLKEVTGSEAGTVTNIKQKD